MEQAIPEKQLVRTEYIDKNGVKQFYEWIIYKRNNHKTIYELYNIRKSLGLYNSQDVTYQVNAKSLHEICRDLLPTMAINTSDKRGLMQQILGEADINVTSNGLTISGPRLSTPRSIPFDESGKCRSCKATEVELDTMITKEGVTIWCSRIKNAQFVPFDVVYDLPGHCFFRIKNKARVFNVPFGDPNPITCATQDLQTDQQDLKRKAKVALDLVEAGLTADAMQDGARWKKAKTAINVLGNLLLAESLSTEKKKTEAPSVEVPTVTSPHQQKDEEDEKKLKEFYDSLSGATTLMGFSHLKPETDNEEKTLEEFYEGVSASTTFLGNVR
uniref:Uncharacterized protein n=1 Tax=Globodera rostochiensis TaxID=31243 RepID=A0A914IGC8_GLORO